MTHTIRASHDAAKKILANVYNADRSSSYSNKKRSVTGTVLSAFIKYDKDGCYVDVKSTYYTLASLKEIASN